jgi:hypothetical protein
MMPANPPAGDCAARSPLHAAGLACELLAAVALAATVAMAASAACHAWRTAPACCTLACCCCLRQVAVHGTPWSGPATAGAQVLLLLPAAWSAAGMPERALLLLTSCRCRSLLFGVTALMSATCITSRGGPAGIVCERQPGFAPSMSDKSRELGCERAGRAAGGCSSMGARIASQFSALHAAGVRDQAPVMVNGLVRCLIYRPHTNGSLHTHLCACNI